MYMYTWVILSQDCKLISFKWTKCLIIAWSANNDRTVVITLNEFIYVQGISSWNIVFFNVLLRDEVWMVNLRLNDFQNLRKSTITNECHDDLRKYLMITIAITMKLIKYTWWIDDF